MVIAVTDKKPDMAKNIHDWIREKYNVVVIEETGKMYVYNSGLFVPFSDTKLKNLIKSFLDEPIDFSEEITRYSTSLYQQVKNHLYGNLHSLKEFDKKITTINCKNGKYFINTEYFVEHSEESPMLSFIQIPVNYNEEAKCPNINKFLIDVFGVDRVAFIYEIIGYLLYRSNKLHKSFIF